MKLLLLVPAFLLVSSVRADEATHTPPTYKAYVPVDYLSTNENKMLSKSTQTSGSTVYTWLAGANGTEGHYFGLGYLDVLLHRYMQADNFVIGWDDAEILEYGAVQNRWTYNRKRSLLLFEAKANQESKWAGPSVVIRNVTDAVVHLTFEAQKTNGDVTLYGVTQHGAKR